MNTKKTSVFQNALIWFGAGVSIAEILTGTYFAPLGMARGLAAILVGHIIGCVMLLESDSHGRMGDVEQKLVMSAAGFLGRQMEM